jgi:acyl-CoA reductase-like NAD-dependent aldehyde dehydrogenase
VQYPVCDIEALIAAGQAAMPGWQAVGAEGRTGICLEMLDRLNKQSFELAHAVMMTTGQGWMMAFPGRRAARPGPGLEAVTYAYREQKFRAGRSDLGKAAGQEPAAGDEEAL